MSAYIPPGGPHCPVRPSAHLPAHPEVMAKDIKVKGMGCLSSQMQTQTDGLFTCLLAKKDPELTCTDQFTMSFNSRMA